MEYSANHVHLKFDSTNRAHTQVSVFVRGANCGALTLRNPEAIWLHHIFQKGCEALRFNFNSSGVAPVPPPEEEVDKVAQQLSKEE